MSWFNLPPPFFPYPIKKYFTPILAKANRNDKLDKGAKRKYVTLEVIE